MKVKYIGKDNDEGFIVDKEYDVLEFGFTDQKIYYRLIPDDYILSGIFGIEEFEITDPTPNKHWIVDIINNVCVTFTPSAWAEDMFWENFYDGKSKEVIAYFQELKRIFPHNLELMERIKEEGY